jgi:N-carbamoylputrescine amidase
VKVAAVQLKARLADVDYNLERAEVLLEQAFSSGCELVVLPEFFPSAVAFHPDMKSVAMPMDGPALGLMEEAARKHGGYVAGSFICSRGADNFNTFVLVSGDGGRWTHDKDQPTMWENCWYVGGTDDGILDTPLGDVGVALCWENVRTRTVRRLRGRVDILVGGSCWWSVPDRAIPLPGKRAAEPGNLSTMVSTPGRMARLLGVPVIHAAHAGDFKARMPLVPGLPYRSHFLGETQVVDARGSILARLTYQDGEAIAVADVESGMVEPTEEPPEGFWIPDLPPLIRFAWSYQNVHGRVYYRLHRRDIVRP